MHTITQTKVAPVPVVGAPGGDHFHLSITKSPKGHITIMTDHSLERCVNCGRYGWHSTERCPETPAVRETYLNPRFADKAEDASLPPRAQVKLQIKQALAQVPPQDWTDSEAIAIRDLLHHFTRRRNDHCRKSVRPPSNKDIRDLMLELHSALTAAPVDSWDATETALVLDAVSTIIDTRKTNVVVVAFGSSQEQR